MSDVARTDHIDKSWDRFVERHSDATVGHLAAWGSVIRDTYGHEAIYLMAEDGDDVVGVLPLVFVRSRLFGSHLVSMPFLDYGGILADSEGAAVRALADAALQVARERGARSLGLRQLGPVGLTTGPAPDRVTMLLPLSSEAAVWKALPSERRNRVRKGEKNGLTAVWGGGELLGEFYPIFAATMRDLGTPVHSRRFFALILEHLAGGARVLLVRDRDGRSIGAAVCLFFRDTIMVPWPASLRSAFHLCPNFTLYWEVIRYGCANGYRTLDLGRSFRNAGTFEFKRQWGAAPHALPWIFIDVDEGAPPSVDRDSRRFAPLVRAWKTLPMPVANALGPRIRGQMPN